MRWKIHFAATTVLSSIACLYWLPPARYTFYPRCPFFALTNLECPGCGMTRALAALLHGQFALSWHYNPLALLLLPMLAAYFATGYARLIRHGQWSLPRLPLSIPAALLVAIALFGVARNLHGTVL
jgi:hypothetical protein